MGQAWRMAVGTHNGGEYLALGTCKVPSLWALVVLDLLTWSEEGTQWCLLYNNYYNSAFCVHGDGISHQGPGVLSTRPSTYIFTAQRKEDGPKFLSELRRTKHGTILGFRAAPQLEGLWPRPLTTAFLRSWKGSPAVGRGSSTCQKP